jgi:hypothetical protein
MSSPTERSLERLRESGWQATKTEFWSPFGGVPVGPKCGSCSHQKFTGKTHDLFGFADILAVRHGRTLAVQATAVSSAANRVMKLCGFEVRDSVIACLEANWEIEVWGWGKRRSDALRRDGSRSTRLVSHVRRTRIVLGGPGLGLRVELVEDSEEPDAAEAISKAIDEAF